MSTSQEVTTTAKEVESSGEQPVVGIESETKVEETSKEEVAVAEESTSEGRPTIKEEQDVKQDEKWDSVMDEIPDDVLLKCCGEWRKDMLFENLWSKVEPHCTTPTLKLTEDLVKNVAVLFSVVTQERVHNLKILQAKDDDLESMLLLSVSYRTKVHQAIGSFPLLVSLLRQHEDYKDILKERPKLLRALDMMKVMKMHKHQMQSKQFKRVKGSLLVHAGNHGLAIGKAKKAIISLKIGGTMSIPRRARMKELLQSFFFFAE